MLAVIDFLLVVYIWIIIIRAIASWFNPNYGHPVMQFLLRITEPTLAPIRRHIPIGRVDFSPIIVIVIIELVRYIIRVIA
jgi:YggT family protein